MNDKTVAEYIIARFETSSSVGDFKTVLKGDGIEGNIVERLWQLISHLKVRCMNTSLCVTLYRTCVKIMFFFCFLFFWLRAMLATSQT